jgi:hypothetical protein
LIVCANKSTVTAEILPSRPRPTQSRTPQALTTAEQRRRGSPAVKWDTKGKQAITDDGILPLFVGILIHDHNTVNYNYGTGNGECNVHLGVRTKTRTFKKQEAGHVLAGRKDESDRTIH